MKNYLLTIVLLLGMLSCKTFAFSKIDFKPVYYNDTAKSSGYVVFNKSVNIESIHIRKAKKMGQ